MEALGTIFCDAVSKSNRPHNLVSSEHFQPENFKYCSMATPWCEISARVLISFIHMEFITPFVTSPVPWGYVLWFNFILGLNFTPFFKTHYQTLPYQKQKKRKFKPRIKLNQTYIFVVV